MVCTHVSRAGAVRAVYSTDSGMENRNGNTNYVTLEPHFSQVTIGILNNNLHMQEIKMSSTAWYIELP